MSLNYYIFTLIYNFKAVMWNLYDLFDYYQDHNV